jgi:hypothetical protein
VLAAGLAIAAASPSTSPAVAATSDYKVATQTLPDGKNVVARWNPCQTITFRVNPNWVGPSTTARNAAIADVKTAFARASAATGITFRYAGTTTEIPKDTSTRWYARQTSAEIVVAWVNPSSSTAKTNLLGKSGSSYASGTGGYAFKYWKVGSDPWKGASGRGFVVINALQNSKFRAGFGSGSTRGALLMHEIGHSLGMLHVGATSQLMYPTVLSRSTTGYASGDLAGLKRVGRTAGCVTTPSWVWTNLS